jgi:alkanesulfonate monooxygenase SsuD/methylene tetrahydromethanopterin reductase-like flavin-dependent oxidoreductase (luciferase family)
LKNVGFHGVQPNPSFSCFQQKGIDDGLWCYVTEERSKAERMVQDILSQTLNRPESELSQRVLVGPAQECAEKLAAYQAAGAQRVFLWPIADELRQLEIFQKQVRPLVES